MGPSTRVEGLLRRRAEQALRDALGACRKVTWLVLDGAFCKRIDTLVVREGV